MTFAWRATILGLAFFAIATPVRATDRFVSPSGAGVPPFTDWSTAATNIQAAIDAASVGDQIWVTNGVYATGGMVTPQGSLTNRITVTKAVVIRSVNGPETTIIQGAKSAGTGNASQSVRCAWLAAGSTLSGFTLTQGSTLSGFDGNGGGVYCVSSNVIITNCLVSGNSANGNGGGVFQGTVQACTISSNTAASGGGVYNTWLSGSEVSANRATTGGGIYCSSNGISVADCLVTGNSAVLMGGGIYQGTCSNCTFQNNRVAMNGGGACSAILQSCVLRSNTATLGGGAYNCLIAGSALVRNSATNSGGGSYASSATAGQLRNCTVTGNDAGLGAGALGGFAVNSILYYNVGPQQSPNYSQTAFTNCCTEPLGAAKLGNNLPDEPMLMSDGIHLRSGSPCISAGNSAWSSGLDIDGQPWAAPPSIGCDEPGPPLLLVTQPRVMPGRLPGQAQVLLEIAGQSPYCWWTKDGTALENDGHFSDAHSNVLAVSPFAPADAGAYQVVASNRFGIVTSAVVNVTVACVDAVSANPSAPYATWADAAATIQDAMDASTMGTVILVTNGIYAGGGRLVPPDGTTNRVVLDKAITVLSVNGPSQTVIEGAWDPGSTNGPGSVRCAWMADGAVLGGFTLQNGSAGLDGGGVWSAGTGLQGSLVNCVVTNCSAGRYGGGAFQGRLDESLLVGNLAGAGGGLASGFAEDCAFISNSAGSGGGVYQSHITGCNLTLNSGAQGGILAGGAAFSCLVATNNGIGVRGGFARNCRLLANSGGGASSSLVLGSLLRGNATWGSQAGTNLNCTFVQNAGGTVGGFSTNCLFFGNGVSGVTGGTRVNCLLGPGDIPSTIDSGPWWLFPNLLSDGLHIASDSPAIGRGLDTGIARADIDGQVWTAPRSIGCDQWNPQPLLVSQPRVLPGNRPGQAQLFLELAGQSAYCWWTKDGTPLENGSHFSNAHSNILSIAQFNLSDAGGYQVVASNSFGMITSALVRVTVACVDAASANPSAPYATWGSAASNIQDAIDASAAGTVILVTNGLYSSGGRLTPSDSTTNRVVLDKPITVLSISGPEQTVIDGAWDPLTTNGLNSVRCAWIADGAVLGGFTLRNGSAASDGGGVWSAGIGLQDSVVNCVITNCSAARNGGGAFQGRLNDCVLEANTAGAGGGTAFAVVDHSLLQGNSAAGNGGGVYQGFVRCSRIVANRAGTQGGGVCGPGAVEGCAVALNQTGAGAAIYQADVFQCTVVSNVTQGSFVAGVDFSSAWNSIIYFNVAPLQPQWGSTFANAGGSGNYYSICYAPYRALGGSITNDPQLLDLEHCATNSACRGAGMNLGFVGFNDIDGEAWNTPPAIGCDEMVDSQLVGPLSVQLRAWSEVAVGGTMPVIAWLSGRASTLQWDFGDGSGVANAGFSTTHSWANAGDYVLKATAFNLDYPTGVVATASIHVQPLAHPILSGLALSNDVFSLQFDGQPGLTYQLQSATNLSVPVDWQPVQSLYSTGQVISIGAPGAADPTRFYRLQIQ